MASDSGLVMIRDTTDQGGATLAVTPAGWQPEHLLGLAVAMRETTSADSTAAVLTWRIGTLARSLANEVTAQPRTPCSPSPLMS